MSWFDRAVFGSWRYVAGPKGYDPEGVLGTLPTFAEALIGTLVGDWLRRGQPIRRTAIRLALAGTLLIAAGVAWGLVFPIIKDLWTSSFVLVSAGVAMVVLAGFHLACDGRGEKMRRGDLLGSFGRNAIAAYALHELTSFLLSADVFQWTYRWARPVVGPELAALVPVILFILLLWWPIAAMDRRGWYLKT
ncbi:acyltransferase family protein [Sphingomonas oryzagri]|uniref:Acyltransferase family protein n=1 Tax=Sphingomonas oryzagri TaxID=3042314 RepID=A0ABT6MY86_9SPHN|nr:acyltransferase family protein [Sphingomonas oryzagri]MDH7637772.1 acyltransferase family protein [Sphingomonas oryzagri]